MDRRYAKRMESYWTRQYRKAIRDLDRVDIGSWFDLWHTHIDWDSKGNRFLEQRMRAATLTYDAYQYALSRAKGRAEPIQVWAHFCEDTGNNAVYVHTPNANGTAFPYVFVDTEWGVAAPPELEHLPLAAFELGRMRFNGETSYVLRLPN